MPIRDADKSDTSNERNNENYASGKPNPDRNSMTAENVATDSPSPSGQFGQFIDGAMTTGSEQKNTTFPALASE